MKKFDMHKFLVLFTMMIIGFVAGTMGTDASKKLKSLLWGDELPKVSIMLDTEQNESGILNQLTFYLNAELCNQSTPHLIHHCKDESGLEWSVRTPLIERGDGYYATTLPGNLCDSTGEILAKNETPFRRVDETTLTLFFRDGNIYNHPPE